METEKCKAMDIELIGVNNSVSDDGFHENKENRSVTLKQLLDAASLEKQRAFMAALSVTEEQVEIGESVAQKTDLWHQFKSNRIGGSKMGQINNHDKPRTPHNAVVDMIVPKPISSWMMTKGTIMEDTAFNIVAIELREILHREGYRDVWMEQTGIRVWKDHPWIAVSADGKVYRYGSC